jgi:hypothetical protein
MEKQWTVGSDQWLAKFRIGLRIAARYSSFVVREERFDFWRASFAGHSLMRDSLEHFSAERKIAKLTTAFQNGKFMGCTRLLTTLTTAVPPRTALLESKTWRPSPAMSMENKGLQVKSL